MDGDIGVESIQGKGSTFFFTAKFEIANRNNISSEDFEKLRNMKVLIVDSDRSNLEIMRSYLEEYEIKVSKSENGEKAIAELLKCENSEDKIDIIISEYNMSDMNGYELASAIKSIPSIRDTKLIMLTSISQKEAAFKVKEKGINVFLSKPVKRDELINCVMTAAGLKQSVENTEEIVTECIQKEATLTHTPKILLAEDNITNRKIVIAMLKTKGLVCDIAENGKEAYQACLKDNYDIVFMDCQMPIMDGYEATKKIRNAEADNKHTKIIAMTANAMDGDKEKCIETGMDDYISKPIDSEKMFKMIEENMKNINNVKIYSNYIDDSLEAFISNSGIALDDAKEIFDDYINSMAENLKNLEEAIESDDFERLAKGSHQLKGSSGNLRINEIYELAKKLEEAAKNKNKSSCEGLFLKIKNYVENDIYI
jgi:CheY-like chemotaxis protein